MVYKSILKCLPHASSGHHHPHTSGSKPLWSLSLFHPYPFISKYNHFSLLDLFQYFHFCLLLIQPQSLPGRVTLSFKCLPCSHSYSLTTCISQIQKHKSVYGLFLPLSHIANKIETPSQGLQGLTYGSHSFTLSSFTLPLAFYPYTLAILAI